MKVSIIIPAYNTEKTIENCITSVLNQSYQEIEVIIVDDGSQDKTADVVFRFNNKKLKLIRQENKGVSAARNKGISVASGDFLMFVDADDYIYPGMVEGLVNYQQKYKVDLVKSGLKRVDKKGFKEEVTCKDLFYYSSSKEIHDCFFEILSNGLNSPVGKLYNSSIIKKYHISFNEDLELSEDLHFNLDFLEKINSMLCVPDIFYQYCIYNSKATRKYRENLFVKRAKAIKMFKDYLDRNFLDNNIIHYLYIKLVYASAMQEIEYGLARKVRLKEIKINLSRQEVEKAISSFSPKGRMEKILLRIIKYRNAFLIDISACIMSLIREKSLVNLPRISV